MQILSHFPNPLSSHTFWILPILPNSLFPSNYISFVTTKIFFPHLSLSLNSTSRFNLIPSPSHVSCPLCFSIPSQNVQSSILRVLNLLCFDVRKLLSHPSPLTHFSIVFFSLSSSSSSSFYHHIPWALLNPLLSSIRTISPPPALLVLFVLFHVNPPRPRGSEAEWKLNAQSAVTTIDLYSPIYRRCEEVC